MPESLQSILQSVLDHLVAEGTERGVQVAIYLDGKKVADAGAGIADPATGRTVDTTTLFPVFSTTKGIAATLTHLLVERGLLGYDTPIAEVWPEFAAHGKQGITVRHALNHTAGLPNMPVGLGHAELCDWTTMCTAIAQLEPVSPPGHEHAYHAITYGWLLGETLRRVDGRTFPELLREEIAGPLGLTDSLFVGIPDAAEPRIAILEAADNAPSQPLPHNATPKAIPDLVQPLHVWMNRADARRACLPASNGIMTAHAIARHYASLLPGGVDGVELLPPERVRLATQPQYPSGAADGSPPAPHFLGYGPTSFFSATAFGHGGYGGSIGFADPGLGLAFGFVRNRLVSDASLPQILEALRRELAA